MDKIIFTYKEKETPLHKVPAAIKLIFLLLYCTIFFFPSIKSISEVRHFYFILRLTLSVVLCVIPCLLYGISYKEIKKLTPILVLGIFILLLKIISLWSIGQLNKDNLTLLTINTLLWTLSFFQNAILSLIAFSSTKFIDIIDTIELLLGFPKNLVSRVKKKAVNKKSIHTLSILVFLTLSFIPLIFIKLTTIKKAIKIRIGKKSKIKGVRVIKVYCYICYQFFYSLLASLLQDTEVKYKSLINRGCF